MNSDDLKKIRGVIRDEVSSTEKRIKGEIKQIVSASEKRLLREADKRERRMVTEIGEFIENNVISRLDEKANKTGIDRLEGKIDRLTDDVLDHKRRIEKIEQVPTIAHQIKK